ncbi:MAG: phosphoribosyltransferase [Chloroflexota bacterium]
MRPTRRELLTWDDFNKLIDHLIPQFEQEFGAMIIITRGGLVPGGILADALGMETIATAAVDFPAEMERQRTGLFAWPRFIQFPEDKLLRSKKVLIVDDVWGSGRTITAVKNRVSAAGGTPYTCVMHFNPYRNLFGAYRPDYYAAITDAYIIYPWEVDRGPDRVLLG